LEAFVRTRDIVDARAGIRDVVAGDFGKVDVQMGKDRGIVI
jgi:hypothetical protein